jgi:hypothetical protein
MADKFFLCRAQMIMWMLICRTQGRGLRLRKDRRLCSQTTYTSGTTLAKVWLSRVMSELAGGRVLGTSLEVLISVSVFLNCFVISRLDDDRSVYDCVIKTKEVHLYFN